MSYITGPTKAEAMKNARILLKKMRSKGWKIRIWENIGWHHEILKGTMSIAPVGSGGDGDKFFSLMGIDNPHGGEMYWTEHYYNKDPNKVYRRQLQRAKEFLGMVKKAIAITEGH